jgi:aerobic-type carbon monoxide dehydrogenase small subunit (CoxS/CutS family)
MAVTNICRCGTYNRIRRAIHRAAELQSGDQAAQPAKV